MISWDRPPKKKGVLSQQDFELNLERMNFDQNCVLFMFRLFMTVSFLFGFAFSFFFLLNKETLCRQPSIKKSIGMEDVLVKSFM